MINVMTVRNSSNVQPIWRAMSVSTTIGKLHAALDEPSNLYDPGKSE